MIKFIGAGLMLISSTMLHAESIVVLGDSISAAYGIEARQGWVALLNENLQEQKLDYEVINASISGDTTAGGLARIGSILKKHQPEVVLVELGANDGLRGLSPKKMHDNLAQIIQRSQKSGAKVLLLSMRIPPNYGKRYTEMFYNVYPNLSAELSIPYVPFILQDVALIKELMQKDGLHPNAKAQPLIRDKVWLYLQKLLNVNKK